MKYFLGDNMETREERVEITHTWIDEWYGAVYGCPICEGIWMMGYHEPELFCPYCGSKLYYKIQ